MALNLAGWTIRASVAFTLGNKAKGRKCRFNMDSRYTQLADVLCGFSTRLKKGEKVLIDVAETPEEFVIALIRSARKHGAVPMVNIQQARVSREMTRAGNAAHIVVLGDPITMVASGLCVLRQRAAVV